MQQKENSFFRNFFKIYIENNFLVFLLILNQINVQLSFIFIAFLSRDKIILLLKLFSFGLPDEKV